MTTITITLPEEHVQRLRDIANRFRVTPEELVRVSIEELFIRSERDFEQALEQVLDKNAELYRRLTQCDT